MSETVEIVGYPGSPARLVTDPENIDNPILDFFASYWRSKRNGACLPMRASFSPQDIRDKLPWVVVVDALPNFTDFRYRVVGAKVARYFLGNSTGKTAREAFADWGTEAVEDVVSLYARACTARAPVRLTAPAIAHEKLVLPDFDTVYLPYSSDGETADRVINVFTFNYRELVENRPSAILSG